jgi:nucleotide-binding universal stress UspA family protein
VAQSVVEFARAGGGADLVVAGSRGLGSLQR